MKDLFFVLLFLFPGAISVFIQDIIIGKTNQKRSDLEKTIEGLFLSIPCLFLTWVIIQLINLIIVRYFGGTWWQIETIEQLKTWLDSLRHFGLYFGLSLISSLIIGSIVATQGRPKSISLRAINALRARCGKADLSGYASVWDEIFSGRGEIVVEIRTKDGFIKKGFVKSNPPGSDKHREITLEGFEVIEKYQGYFDDETLVYFNLDNGTAITLYDMTAYEEQANKIKQQLEEERQ